jgi:hypothetical protein
MVSYNPCVYSRARSVHEQLYTIAFFYVRVQDTIHPNTK